MGNSGEGTRLNYLPAGTAPVAPPQALVAERGFEDEHLKVSRCPLPSWGANVQCPGLATEQGTGAALDNRELFLAGKQTPAGEGHTAMGTKQRTPLYLISWDLGEFGALWATNHSAFLQLFATTFGLAQYPRSGSTWAFGVVQSTS